MPSPRKHTGHVYGYRAWRVLGDKLYSLGGSARPWPVDKPKTAICWRNFTPWAHGPAPVWEHKCGIYAWKDLPKTEYSPQGMKPVWGIVELTGKVIVHSEGYRAQYAQPVAIAYSEGAEAVAQRYGLVVMSDLTEWRG